MNENDISRLAGILIDRFNYQGPENFNLDNELRNLRDPVTNRTLTEDEIREIERRVLIAINYRRSHDNAVIIPISVVSDPRLHEEWYDDWLEVNNNETGSYYWRRLEHYLFTVLTRKYTPENSGVIIRSIDEATCGIIKNIANPLRPEFNYKGLVVGYVQSGKTANFSALIAKAADAGYRLIIVLAGIHNILRLQTQIRLDKELTGMNDRSIDDIFISQPSDIKRWNRLTTANNDFSNINVDPFNSYCTRSTPAVAIIKKNCRIMDRLIEYIGDSDPSIRSQMPLLIIDDEADQASIDTNANTPDTDPAATNQRIRGILYLFNKKAYIGYTATPFANVLIDMTTQHDNFQEDLYPRNFIVSLPEPEGYFGASTVFEGNLSEYFVVPIPDENNDRQRLLNNEATETLIRAIDEFIICCAVRNIRSDKDKPMSMLVHISHRIGDMSIIRGLVENCVNVLRIRLNDTESRNRMREEYNHLWVSFSSNSETINRELGLNNVLPPFDLIWETIPEIIGVLRIAELNSQSEDILDYTTGEEIKVIAIGGNQLSRGLTLEGLMTSYYLRESKQYDTLLQMARWFGYRIGYEDLTRVYTTERIWENFEHLALVEEEMRSEIYRYEEERKTPAEMALAIRSHRRLNITARNKIGAGQPRQISYSESLNQTICFPLNNPEALLSNYNLGDSFVRQIGQNHTFIQGDDNPGIYLARDIPGSVVLNEFLTRYTFADREATGARGLDSARFLDYISRRLNNSNPELQNWNIALVGNANPVPNTGDPYTYGNLRINRIQRSRKYTEFGYNIGVLTDPNHLVIDLNNNPEDPYDGRSPQNPLLLLYLIWRESKASKFVEEPRYDQRIDLYRFIATEKIDVLGLAIVLPKSDYEPYDYIGQ